MEPTDITCPSCGHSIDCHHPDEGYIDACWGVPPVTDENPEGLCECSLRPSEIAGALMEGMVSKDWHGLMAILEDIYPEDVFPTMADDPGRDAGPRIVSLLRVVDELQERLDRIEALHANPELIAVHEGHGAEYRCNECRNSHHPCPTVKAARGEQS